MPGLGANVPSHRIRTRNSTVLEYGENMDRNPSGGNWFLRALLFGWELPQNVLGLSLLGIQQWRGRVRRVVFERERLMIEMDKGAAISLGLFVFWTSADNEYVPVGAENADHEYGHSIQSRWFGPAYLAIIGVPSQMRVFYALVHRRFTGQRWKHYYDGFPENWADRLGCVDLSLRPRP